MIVYEGTKESFIIDVETGHIADIIKEKIRKLMHRGTGESEYNSWRESLQNMYMVLNDVGIPSDAGIAIEYNIPQTAKRVDFMISGYGEKKDGNIIIIELKQWTSLSAIDGRDGLVSTYTGHALRSVVHPSYQAWSYKVMIEDYNEKVRNDKIGLLPCAYLHNYSLKDNGDPLYAPQYKTYLDEAPAFTSGVAGIRRFIKNGIRYGDSGRFIFDIDSGKLKPSKNLQDSVLNMLKGKREFVLLDDQKVAYEEILDVSRKCQKDNKKRTVIVKGGPGTGKSVIAINLLSTLISEGQFCQYVSKNSAPRNVYSKKLSGEMRKAQIDNLFIGSGSFTCAEKNMAGTLIVDEAHRLNEKSGLYSNQGENQIKEIINASLCSVFFIDENQRVTLKDIGSVDEIKKWAKKAGSEVSEMELTSQFRCNGSDGYLSFIDNALGIRETANYDMKNIDYNFEVIDDPSGLRDKIIEKNKINNKARILAGYCWEWPSKTKSDPDYHDIKIGDFAISWNLNTTNTFAIDPESVNQAGCIHTSQGLEFDYVGVIIGPDMRYEKGKVICDYSKRASTDQSLKGIKTIARKDPEKADQIADEIIKNTYRTLLTRGMKGCYVYCCDEALAEYLKSFFREED